MSSSPENRRELANEDSTDSLQGLPQCLKDSPETLEILRDIREDNPDIIEIELEYGSEGRETVNDLKQEGFLERDGSGLQLSEAAETHLNSVNGENPEHLKFTDFYDEPPVKAFYRFKEHLNYEFDSDRPELYVTRNKLNYDIRGPDWVARL